MTDQFDFVTFAAEFYVAQRELLNVALNQLWRIFPKILARVRTREQFKFRTCMRRNRWFLTRLDVQPLLYSHVWEVRSWLLYLKSL